MALYNVGSMPRNDISKRLANALGQPDTILQNSLKDVESYRRRNPLPQPFATGTPTLARRQLNQQQSQFEQEQEWAKEQFGKEYELALRKQAEDERQNAIANQLSYARLANSGDSGGSGGGGSSGGNTLTERQANATATLYNSAINRYNNLLDAGYDYPLYYTVNTLMADKNWTKAAMESGADVKEAVDSLLRTHGFSPDQYFETKQGAKLKSKYQSLYKKADFKDSSVSTGNVDVDEIIKNASASAGVPHNIFAALVKAESGGNPKAKSPAGAIGLAQLMPQTAKGLGVDPYDPVQNAMGGAKYLKQQYDRFGDWSLALSAYNAGPGAVQKYGGIPPYKETQNYVKRVLDYAGMG